jgi:L,D-peptidoglycan transpeptidase YkuD (ErfK/YbiS/YcfS/YnhG family)
MRPVSPSDGWCDDPRSALYNRRVALPCRASHEKLWRADRLYDLVIVLDYNLHPRRKNRGSAIFLHCARPDFAPTSGCIALLPDDLRRLLPRLARKAVLTVR